MQRSIRQDRNLEKKGKLCVIFLGFLHHRKTGSSANGAMHDHGHMTVVRCARYQPFSEFGSVSLLKELFKRNCLRYHYTLIIYYMSLDHITLPQKLGILLLAAGNGLKVVKKEDIPYFLQ